MDSVFQYQVRIKRDRDFDPNDVIGVITGIMVCDEKIYHFSNYEEAKTFVKQVIEAEPVREKGVSITIEKLYVEEE